MLTSKQNKTNKKLKAEQVLLPVKQTGNFCALQSEKARLFHAQTSKYAESISWPDSR